MTYRLWWTVGYTCTTEREFLATKVALSIAGEAFVVEGRAVIALGWKSFGQHLQESRCEKELEQDAADAVLPPLRQGQTLLCVQAVVLDKRTQPPKAFTDATLIQAMCNVAKYVSDPRARQILRETDGIGTPAIGHPWASAPKPMSVFMLREHGLQHRPEGIRNAIAGGYLVHRGPPTSPFGCLQCLHASQHTKNGLFG